MKKLMITVAFGALLAQTGAFAQAAQDPQLQANASNAAVQEELDQPDGVAGGIFIVMLAFNAKAVLELARDGKRMLRGR